MLKRTTKEQSIFISNSDSQKQLPKAAEINLTQADLYVIYEKHSEKDALTKRKKKKSQGLSLNRADAFAENEAAHIKRARQTDNAVLSCLSFLKPLRLF